MRKTHRSLRPNAMLAVLGLVCSTPLPAEPTSTTPATRPTSACSAAPYHELDFWIGDWETFEADGSVATSIARARVRPMAQGCALHELYEQVDGLVGEAILSYDPVRRQWQQTWVTNRGSIMVLWGGFVEGALVLEGESHLADGTTVLQRITWKALADGVRESALLSKDGGKSWAPAFDVVFRKRGV